MGCSKHALEVPTAAITLHMDQIERHRIAQRKYASKRRQQDKHYNDKYHQDWLRAHPNYHKEYSRVWRQQQKIKFHVAPDEEKRRIRDTRMGEMRRWRARRAMRIQLREKKKRGLFLQWKQWSKRTTVPPTGNPST